ncbi:MAG: hypothetical protein LRZ84_21255 [Desertifilum sp.]|nr:hypothetical protein [Desertifilum sp.]
MSEPESTVVSLAPVDDVIESAYSPSSDLTAVSDTLIKLTDEGVVHQSNAAAVCAPVCEAMRRLAEMIAKLRQPESGWSSQLPHTPDNLFLYVIEEAYEVLDATQVVIPQLTQETIEKEIDSHYLLVEDLGFKLLWYVAKSSYRLMQLMGGIPATVSQANAEWQSGMLRLVAVLEAQTAETQWSLDLTTHQVPPASVQASVLVQFAGEAVPHTVESLRQEFIYQLLAATPEVREYIAGMRVELLQPGKSWQKGTLKLKFDFEFIPDTEVEGYFSEDFGQVKLNDTAAIADLARHWLWQQFHNMVTQLLETYSLETVGEKAYLSTTISQASAIVTCCVSESPYFAFLNANSLEAWRSRLLWHLTGVSYPVMRLLGGVKAYVLQPNASWEVGTLRLVAVLQVKTLQTKLQLDLATGDTRYPTQASLKPDAAIQLVEDDIVQEPECADNLITQFWAEVRSTSPLLKLFLEGIQLELQHSDRSWVPGLMRLHLDLEFLSDTGE